MDHILWHLTSVVALLAWAGAVVSWIYVAYQSTLFRRRQRQARSTPPTTWLESVEIAEIAQPHAWKMRKGALAMLACGAVFAASILLAVWVGY